MAAAPAGEIRIADILNRLPHRYPFLLVDRILAYEPGVSITALKNVTINEPFFQGHFPGLPVMPGVLLMEAVAQTGGVLVSLSLDADLSQKVFMFTGLDQVRFRKPVVPGDQLVIRCFDIKHRMTLWKMSGEVDVNGEVVAEGRLTAAVVDRSAMP